MNEHIMGRCSLPSSLAGSSYHGEHLKVFAARDMVQHNQAFFATPEGAAGLEQDIAALENIASTDGLRFIVDLRFSTAFTADSVAADFNFSVEGLDNFSCETSTGTALRATPLCNSEGRGEARAVVLDVTSCPRLIRDPGFSVDLKGGTTLLLPFATDRGTDVLLLPAVCPNLPELLRQQPTVSPSAASSGFAPLVASVAALAAATVAGLVVMFYVRLIRKGRPQTSGGAKPLACGGDEEREEVPLVPLVELPSRGPCGMHE